MKKIYKKANITFIVITVIISILSFFIYLGFFAGIQGNLVSETDDLICRAFVAAKDTKIVKTAEFFSKINEKCKKDDITIKSKTRNEIFKETSDIMVRCWYRYGEGNYDFMSNFNTEGNWCFSCATIKFKGDAKGNVYNFNQFKDWANQNKFKLKNGTEIEYANYLNIKYSDISENDLGEMKGLLDDGSLANDEDLRPMAIYIQEQYDYLQDLKLKEINTNENVYVVYRYDRVSRDIGEIITEIGKNMAIGAATGAAVSIGTNIALTILTGPIGGAKLIYSIYKNIMKVTDVVKKERLLTKIKNILEKLYKFGAKFTKFTSGAAKIGATAGGVYGATYNANYVQYVDIMTQEQYYRLCGTERADLSN